MDGMDETQEVQGEKGDEAGGIHTDSAVRTCCFLKNHDLPLAQVMVTESWD